MLLSHPPCPAACLAIGPRPSEQRLHSLDHVPPSRKWPLFPHISATLFRGTLTVGRLLGFRFLSLLFLVLSISLSFKDMILLPQSPECWDRRHAWHFPRSCLVLGLPLWNLARISGTRGVQPIVRAGATGKARIRSGKVKPHT